MNLFFSLILNCFCLFFKSFSQWIINKFSLFCQLILVRRQYFFSCGIFKLNDFCLMIRLILFKLLLIILYWSFSSLLWSLIVMILLYVYSKRLSLKRNRLSGDQVVSLTKKNMVLHFIFYKSSPRRFHYKTVCTVQSNFFWYFKI